MYLSIIIILASLSISIFCKKTKKERFTQKPMSCAKSNKIDPVNEPDYNMKETIKNTILIEQHLADSRKYCKHCLVKHFLLSIGLIEEAIWMAEDKHTKYPYLLESKKIYNDIFENWRSGIKSREKTLHDVRKWRQSVLPHYFPTSTT